MRVLALMLVAGGCADGVTVCDGEDGVRLAVRYRSPAPVQPGEAVLTEHGTTWLFVDGACGYHVRSGARWDDAQAGALDDDARLAEDLALAELPARAGVYQGDLPDATTLVLEHAGATLECRAGCIGAAIPDWLVDVNARAAVLVRDLADAAAVVDLPQRVVVVAQPVPPTPAFVWPASLPPDQLALTRDQAEAAGAGASTLVDGDDGAALRQLRRDARDLASPPAALYTTVDAALPPAYAVYLRDALPGEGDDGLVVVGR